MIKFNGKQYKIEDFRKFAHSVNTHDYGFMIGCTFTTYTGKVATLTRIISADPMSDFPLEFEYSIPEKNGVVDIFHLASAEKMVLSVDPSKFPHGLMVMDN